MKYHFLVHSENDGYWAECRELDGCITETDGKGTLEDLYSNCEEALDCFLWTRPENTARRFPPPDDRLDGQLNIIAVPILPARESDVLARLKI